MAKEKDTLNPRQALFVDEYAKDRNGTQAAIRAGYAERSAKMLASRLLAQPKIQKAVQVKFAEIAERNAVTQDRVLLELRRVGFSDLRETARWDEFGVRFKDSGEITDDAAASIQTVSSRREVRRDRETGELIETTTMKMTHHPKHPALESMARYTGLYDGTRADGTERWNELLDALSGERRPPSGDPEEPWVD